MSEASAREPARRVLLALDHAKNREVLRDWIEADPALEPGDDEDFDVVVFDGPAFARRRGWLRALRAEAAPIYVPCLLTTPLRRVSLLSADLWRDVDDLITTPIRIEELRVRLERLLELRRRSEAAARRLAELGRSNTDLQQFAFVAAHELSSPLAVVTGAIETVDARHRDDLSGDVVELLAAARTSSHRLRRLIDDLLAYSQAGRVLDLRPTSLPDVIEGVLAELRTQLEETGGRVETDGLPDVLGEPEQLRLVFANLIGNALKYTRPGVPPVVRIDAERNGDAWCVRVADNGIGVDTERAETMFAMFERDQRDGDRPGSGIGLALCRRILERHGGRIWIESADGGGTVVKLTLRPAEAQTTR